jgi:hypothetical protein
MRPLEAIREELTKAFIIREYADRIGIMKSGFEDEAYRKYLNDPTFHARVQLVVAGIMQIVQEHIPNSELVK